MGPEGKAVGKQALDVLEERRPDPAPLRIGVDEEVAEVVVGQRREGDDAAILLDDPGLVLWQEPVVDEGARLLR